MKSDIDQLMQAYNIDVLLVTGAADHNPPMVYLTGGGHVTRADYIKKRGEPAVLFHGVMERDEAAKTGLITRSYTKYPADAALKEANGDPIDARAFIYQQMLQDMGINGGRIALYGMVDIASSFAIFTRLAQRMPGLEFVYDPYKNLLGKARVTKEEDELNRIRRMGKITTEVVRRTAELLTSSDVHEEVLLKPGGSPLTIGDVKNQINLWLMELGAENPEGTIFAIGRDAGVPHSSGNPTDLLRLGQTIVFDIFPCEIGGGYFYDFTRTWCLGYAPDDVQKLYGEVKFAYEKVMESLKVGMPFRDAQELTCDIFEEMGHPTVKTNPAAEEGYIHSIGHGLGLNIHEAPSTYTPGSDPDILLPGMALTIEPGLYYPSRGMGIRLEDTVIILPDGSLEIPAPYPMDLVLPVKSR